MSKDYGRVMRTSTNLKELLGAVTLAGKEFRIELEPEVRSLLEHPDLAVREEAIATLGMRWKVPGFRRECERIWRSDAEDSTRVVALHSWMAYDARSRNIETVTELVSILRSRSESNAMRSTALFGLGTVMDSRRFLRETSDMLRRRPEEEIDDLVPWEEIDRLVEECGG